MRLRWGFLAVVALAYGAVVCFEMRGTSAGEMRLPAEVWRTMALGSVTVFLISTAWLARRAGAGWHLAAMTHAALAAACWMGWFELAYAFVRPRETVVPGMEMVYLEQGHWEEGSFLVGAAWLAVISFTAAMASLPVGGAARRLLGTVATPQGSALRFPGRKPVPVAP